MTGSTSRRDGTSRFYSMPVDDLDRAPRRLWPLIREQVAATTAAGAGRAPAARRADEAAGEVAGVLRVRGRRMGSAARRAVRRRVLSVGGARPHRPTLVVGDLGCGTGQLTETVAPYVARDIG